MNELTHLSIFSGIGGLDLAAEWAGFRTVGQCEWADYPRAVLEKHWPWMPRWRDIRTLTGDDFYEKTGLRTVTVLYGKRSMYSVANAINSVPSADVAPVRRGRCDVCSGKAVLTQEADNGYSLEIDSEKQETSLWYGDNCLAVFHIDFCPNCGARMDLEV